MCPEKKLDVFFPDLTDGYTTKDIMYEWGPAAVVVGNGEMAQFEYKGNNVSSGIDVYSVGKKCFKKSLYFTGYLCHAFLDLHHNLVLM